ncbi:MAG: glycosyltransferase family 4 protein [Candidatus Kapabacteria bacterium]|nr:glycosyltransferase family 4 protein [Candidatus Kapabacteria bacterium]
MKILVLLPRIPIPARDGGSIVMYQTLRELHTSGNQVDVFALNTHKHHADPAGMAEICSWVNAANVDSRVTFLGLISSIVPFSFPRGFGYNGPVPYWIRRFAKLDVLTALRKAVHERGPYDIILCESLFTAGYGLALSNYSENQGCAPILLRAHNIEHRIQERLSRDSEQPWYKRLYGSLLARQTMRYEKDVAQRVNGIVAISDEDARFFITDTSQDQVTVVSPGVDLPQLPYVEVDNNAICLLGSLNWAPNVNSVLWFVHSVFPIVQAMRPGATVHIAGKDTPLEIEALHDGKSIFVYGEIDNALAFRRSKAISVVPLKSGSGIRIKILESLAASCAVVTTSVGCEGLRVDNRKHLRIENDPKPFAEACVNLLNDRALADSLGKNGRELVSSHYSWSHSNELLANFMGKVIERATRRSTEVD